MDINIRTLVTKTVVMFLVFGVALFLPAGTINWTAGWAFVFMFFGFVVIFSLWLYKVQPGIAEGANVRVQTRPKSLG